MFPSRPLHTGGPPGPATAEKALAQFPPYPTVTVLKVNKLEEKTHQPEVLSPIKVAEVLLLINTIFSFLY